MNPKVLPAEHGSCKGVRATIVETGAHQVGVAAQYTKGRFESYSTKKRPAEQRAILEGVQRIADFAPGKVKGLTEKEWKEETRRRLAESESVTAKVLAAKQVAATSKRTSKSPLRRLWR